MNPDLRYPLRAETLLVASFLDAAFACQVFQNRSSSPRPLRRERIERKLADPTHTSSQNKCAV